MREEALTTTPAKEAPPETLPVPVEVPDSEEFGVRKVEADVIRDVFLPLVMKMAELEDEAAQIAAEGETGVSKKLSKRAREVRLAYKRIRIEVAKKHKEYKAYYLAGGRYVDAWRRSQHEVSEAREAKMQEVETHFERMEAERIAAIDKERREELARYNFHTEMSGIGEMEADVYASLLGTAVKRYEEEQEAERLRKEEEERQKEEARRLYREAAAERARLEQEAAVMRKKVEAEAKARRRAEDALRRREEEAAVQRRAEERRRLEKAEAQRRAEEAEKAKGDEERFRDFVDALQGVQDMGPFESDRYGTAYRWACVQLKRIEDEVGSLVGPAGVKP